MGKKKKQKQLTTDEIVDDIITNLSPKMIKMFKNAIPNEDGSYVAEFHFGVGTQIRNIYHLWDYGNADDISGEIIDKLVKKIKENS